MLPGDSSQSASGCPGRSRPHVGSVDVQSGRSCRRPLLAGSGVSLPDDELGTGADRIEDPNGEGPHIWFQVVPEKKSIKNRLHLDVNASGGRSVPLDTRRERVEAEAARLVSLGATRLRTIATEGVDHYAVALLDPEGNEFDIN